MVKSKKEEKALISLGDVQEYLPSETGRPIMDQAMTATISMGLPKEATVSLVQAIQAKAALESRTRRQLALSDQDKRKILNVRGFLSPDNLKKASELSKKEGVPLESISMLQFGAEFTPYVQVKALMMKIDADPRLKKSVDVVDQKIEGGEDPYAFFRVKIRFWTGQEFEGIGAASRAGLGDKFKNRKFNMEDIINFARTRALGDAARKALMLSYDSLPEEIIEEEVKATTYKVVDKATGEKKMSKAETISAIRATYDISPSLLMAKLGELKETPGITVQQVTIADIWEAAKAISPEVIIPV